VGEAVESRVGEDLVVKEGHPLGDVSVAGEDGGASPIAFTDDLVEVVGLFLGEALKAEVVDDQEGGRDQLEQFLFQGVIGPGGIESFEHPGRFEQQDAFAAAACDMGHGVGDESLADTDRAGEDDVFPALDPFQTDEPLEPVTIESDLGLPVEAFQHLVVVDFSALQAPLERPLGAALNLIAEQQFEKLQMGELVAFGVGSPLR